MIDPFGQLPVLDMMMGGGMSRSPTGPAGDVYERLRQVAEQKFAEAQAKNPGAAVPPIDYSALARAADDIAAGRQPSFSPESVAQAERHMGELGMPAPTGGAPTTATPPFVPQEQSRPGFGAIGRTFEGQDVDPEMARSARNRALLDAGTAILARAPSGDLAGGLAAGASTFTGSMDQSLRGGLERKRQTERDELARRGAEEGITASAEARARAARGEGRVEEDRALEAEARQGKTGAMLDLADQVEQIAGADSPEAARAKALLKGGPALYPDLESLHEEVVGRSRFDEDQDRLTDAQIRAIKKKVGAGVEEDPLAAGRRADRGLALEAERTRLSAAQARGQTGRLTQNNLYDEISAETKRLYEIMVSQNTNPYTKKLEEGVNQMDLLDEAAELAERRVLERTNKLFGPGAGGTGGAGPAVGGSDISDRDIVEQVGRLPGIREMDPNELRQRLMRTTGGDAARVERLLAMIAGMQAR